MGPGRYGEADTPFAKDLYFYAIERARAERNTPRLIFQKSPDRVGLFLSSLRTQGSRVFVFCIYVCIRSGGISCRQQCGLEKKRHKACPGL